MEERIVSEITLSYKAINSKGETTIEITPFTLRVADQSPQSASALLIGAVSGLLSPAQAQIK